MGTSGVEAEAGLNSQCGIAIGFSSSSKSSVGMSDRLTEDVIERRCVVKRQRTKWPQSSFNSREAVGTLFVSATSVQKLGPHDRADSDVGHRLRPQSRFNGRAGSLQVTHPRVRIQRV
jgi:hypothetical protein